MAVAIIEMAARVSQAITRTPWAKDCPFKPTICSADRLVNNKDPAMVIAPKLRPPK